MKKTATQFLQIGLLILALNAVLFVSYHQIYYRSYQSRNPKKDKIYHTLILSDSHGLCLDTILENEGFLNFSAESDNYEDMRRKLAFAIDLHPEIKTVVISVDPHTLSLYRESMNNRDRSVIYQNPAREWEWNGQMGLRNYALDYLRYYVVLLNPKAADLIKRTWSGNIQQFLGKKQMDKPQPDWANESQKLTLVKARIQSQFPDNKVSEALKSHLEEMLRFCQKRQITVVGIRFPVSREYEDARNGMDYGAEAVFQKSACPVLRFDSLFLGESKWFKDQDHLNTNGGKILAKALLSKVRAAGTTSGGN